MLGHFMFNRLQVLHQRLGLLGSHMVGVQEDHMMNMIMRAPFCMTLSSVRISWKPVQPWIRVPWLPGLH